MTRAIEFERVRQSGKRIRTEHLEARAVASPFSYCRVGVVVGKHGHTIVARNKLRRQLRELSRTVVIPNCSGFDLVIRVFPAAYEAMFDVLRAEVEQIKQQMLLFTS